MVGKISEQKKMFGNVKLLGKKFGISQNENFEMLGIIPERQKKVMEA